MPPITYGQRRTNYIKISREKIHLLIQARRNLEHINLHVTQLEGNISLENFDLKDITDITLSLQHIKNLIGKYFKCTNLSSKIKEMNAIAILLHYIATIKNLLYSFN